MTYKEDLNSVATLDLPWNKLKNANILITGATGLIGSCLVDILMSRTNKDYHVYASGRNEDRARCLFSVYEDDPNFHFFKYNVIDPLIREERFDFIIHAASNASPNFFINKPVEVIKSNIIGVSNLLDYGISHGLKRFLFVSSGEVYGEGDGRVFCENDSGYVCLLSPRSCYPSSKRAAETLCASYSFEYGVEVVIARPCHIYGPNFTESDNRVYAQFIRNVLQGEDLVLKSDGSQIRSWCYVVDCVSALLHILLKGENGEAYNIADEKSVFSIKELAMMVASIGKKQVVFAQPTSNEKKGFNKVSRSVFSTEKLMNLGWSVEKSMEDNLRETINNIVINMNNKCL